MAHTPPQLERRLNEHQATLNILLQQVVQEEAAIQRLVQEGLDAELTVAQDPVTNAWTVTEKGSPHA